MKRVDLNFNADGEIFNFLIHAARYKFCTNYLRPTDKVLEIGSGYGYGSRLLSEYCKEVVAIEPDETSVSSAINTFVKNNLYFIAGEFDSVFANKWSVETTNTVISLEVIEHLEKEDQHKFMENILILKPEKVIISTPRYFEGRSENRMREHKHEFSPKGFEKFLNTYFSDVQIFSQNDTVIGFQNIQNAWNMIGVCRP